MSSATARYTEVRALTLSTTPVRVFPPASRVAMLIQNPAGSGAVVEAQFSNKAYGSGITIAEGQAWHPTEGCPSNEIWLSSNAVVVVRVSQAMV